MAKMIKLITNLDFIQTQRFSKPKGILKRKPFTGLRRILHTGLGVGQSAEVSHACIAKGRVRNGKKLKNTSCEMQSLATATFSDPSLAYMVKVKHPDGIGGTQPVRGLIQKVWKTVVPDDYKGTMFGKTTQTAYQRTFKAEQKRLPPLLIPIATVATKGEERNSENRRNVWRKENPDLAQQLDQRHDYASSSLGHDIDYARE